MTYSFDTGFFYHLLSGSGDKRVQNAWESVGQGKADGALSSIVCFELYRHGLRGSLPREQTEALVNDLPRACRVIAIDELERCKRAARLAHGNGLSMADAFVLEAALMCNADRLYTTDVDFEEYEGTDIEIIPL